MTITVKPLCANDRVAYESLVRSEKRAFIYSTLLYRDFLIRVLDNCRDVYLGAWDGDELVGALPSFIRFSERYGNVVNSLPFFGSNGGMLIAPQIQNADVVRKVLQQAFHETASQMGASASTVVSNPLLGDHLNYESSWHHDLRDYRIGQMTPLPHAENHALIADSLMAIIHQKTRNCIRKAQKSGLRVTHSDSLTSLKGLAELHRRNLESIGGLVKPWSVFAAIRDIFTYDRDYRIYLAELDGQIISALLVLYHNCVAEYYIPATSSDHRALQPMSLLIFEAMGEAVRRGCQWWNWGGTWASQSGVYQFKSRWGTNDYPYYYFTRVYDPRILNNRSQDLLTEYPYFYVAPYASLQKSVA